MNNRSTRARSPPENGLHSNVTMLRRSRSFTNKIERNSR